MTCMLCTTINFVFVKDGLHFRMQMFTTCLPTFPLYEEFRLNRIVHCVIPIILACILVLIWECGLVIMLFLFS